jgi:quercetin dioxygenase-like cupin family protein
VIPLSLYSWDEVKSEELSDKIHRQYVNGERMTLAKFIFKKGAVAAPHRHDHEQVMFVQEGLIELTLLGRKVRVGEGQVLVIPPNVEHSAVVLEDTIDFDVFSPVRGDWLEGRDQYLRG